MNNFETSYHFSSRSLLGFDDEEGKENYFNYDYEKDYEENSNEEENKFDDNNNIAKFNTHQNEYYSTSKEFQINTHNDITSSRSSVSNISGNRFVVIWHSYGQNNSVADEEDGIYGRIFNANGQGINPVFKIDIYKGFHTGYPSVSDISGKRFVVVWHSYSKDGSGTGIYGQYYDSIGVKIGNEFQVNTQIIGRPIFPTVTAIQEGFVVIWNDVFNSNVYGQCFDKVGSKIGEEFQVNTICYNNQAFSAISNLRDGGFVIAWQVYEDIPFWAIYGQRYNSFCQKVGNRFQVNVDTTVRQWSPAIAGLSDGGFVVIWAQHLPSFKIYGRKYGALGERIYQEFQINVDSSDCSTPAITSLKDNGFVVVWYGRNVTELNIYGRYYTRRLESNEFRVNDYTNGMQWYPQVDSMRNRQFVVTWQNYTDNNLYGRVYFLPIKKPNINLIIFIIAAVIMPAAILPLVMAIIIVPLCSVRQIRQKKLDDNIMLEDEKELKQKFLKDKSLVTFFKDQHQDIDDGNQSTTTKIWVGSGKEKKQQVKISEKKPNVPEINDQESSIHIAYNY